MLELRPDARVAGRARAAGRHRRRVSRHAGGGDVLPDAASSRVRRGRDVAVVVHGIAVPRVQPFVAIPVFPSRFFRHSSIYVSTAAGIASPRDLVDSHRQPGIPDDGARVDQGNTRRRIRRAGRQRHLCHRRRGGARAIRKDQPRPAAEHPRRADRPRADARADACARRDRRVADGADAVDVCGGRRARTAAVRGFRRRRARITAGRASFRSCTPS